jgi:hypothetical protein
LHVTTLGVTGLHESQLVISELYTAILNSLRSIGNEDDRWILVNKVVSEPGNDDNVKRNRLLENTDREASMKGYRTVRVALSYRDIDSERKQFIDRMSLQLKEAMP